jgi:hypothetical protein
MENKTTINSSYEDGIFISYAHIDNTRFVEGHKGWVDALHEHLGLRLYQLLGEKPIMWRDPLLPRYESFREMLVIRLREVTFLVVILSPRYVRSQECLKELHQFCHPEIEAEPNRTDAKARVFKLIKTPIDDCEHPEELQGLLGYKFYEIDPVTDRLREFQHEFGFDSFPKFIDSVYDVAKDITEVIKRLKKTTSGQLTEPIPTTTVYLAETESGLDKERINIKRELMEHGYYVLPDKDLPRDVTKLEQEVRGYLKRSRLSLHLIGGNYDRIPERERVRSYARIQYDLAVERSAEDPDFSQLIWMPRGLKVQDDRQEEFIKSVRSNTSGRTELMQDIREDLKSYLISRLKSLTAEPVVKSYDEPLRIYLICNSKDYNATKQLKDFLFDQNFEVLGLAKSKNNVKDYNQYLSLCDVAMIFQDQADEGWRELKLCDLRKIASYDPSRKLLAKAVYLAGPMTEDKEGFRSVEVKVIKERGEFPPKELIQFIEQVRSQANARVQQTKGAGK